MRSEGGGHPAERHKAPNFPPSRRSCHENRGEKGLIYRALGKLGGAKGDGSENHGVAEAMQALDASLGGALLVAGVVVSGAEVFERGAGCEHVVRW